MVLVVWSEEVKVMYARRAAFVKSRVEEAAANSSAES